MPEIETRRQRRERQFGPRNGKPVQAVRCPEPPRAAPRLWDVCTALRLWNGGLFGDWRDFDFKRLRLALGRPCLPYRN